MADAKIDIVGPGETSLLVSLYNQVFQPSREVEFFQRRFLGRMNILILVAAIDRREVGFHVGFELKPDIYFAWLYGVVPEFRRQGVASQLFEASSAWAANKGYEWLRIECQNQHRPMLHMAIRHGCDIVGIRYDPSRYTNLVIFEKELLA